jgi:peptidyl-prolyl cis-trans isomerase D
MVPAGFEAQVRQDLTLQQLANGVASPPGRAYVSEPRAGAADRKREVMDYRFGVDAYRPRSSWPMTRRRSSTTRASSSRAPKQAKAEYVVLTMDAVSSQLAVTMPK